MSRSPISSMKSVPPSACSKTPLRVEEAPVNEPFSWPNSADSMSVPGNAVPSKMMNGPFTRGLDSWMASASCSLPVPSAA